MSKRPKKRANATNIYSGKLEGTDKKQWVAKAVEMLKSHHSAAYIREFLEKNKTGSRSQQAIDTVINEANAIVTEEHFTQAEEIRAIHIDRYNRQADHLLETKDADDMDDDELEGMDAQKMWRLREKKINAYLAAIQTLVQKEELLQFHNKNFTLEINTETTVEVKEKKERLKIDKLTWEQKLRLYQLMQKCEKDVTLLSAITPAGADQEQKTEDAEFEVVDEANISKIQIEDRKEDPVKPKAGIEVAKFRLQDAMKRMAAEKFKDHGFNLTDDEKKLLGE